MLKVIIAFLLALSIGALCRYFEIPVPAPPKLLGAMLIVAITVGYLGTDWVLTRQLEPGTASAASSDRAEGLPSSRD